MQEVSRFLHALVFVCLCVFPFWCELKTFGLDAEPVLLDAGPHKSRCRTMYLYRCWTYKSRPHKSSAVGTGGRWREMGWDRETGGRQRDGMGQGDADRRQKEREVQRAATFLSYHIFIPTGARESSGHRTCGEKTN